MLAGKEARNWSSWSGSNLNMEIFFLGDVSLGSCSVDFVKSLLIREVQEFLVLRAQSGLSPTYPST
jgi:hypothetical protein